MKSPALLRHGARVVVLLLASAAAALPVVRKTPGGPWVTQVGSDFTVPAGQTIEWAVRLCNDTGVPITGRISDYLHSGECTGHELQRLLCPPLTTGTGALVACDDAASPPITAPALDVDGIVLGPNECADVIFATRVELLTAVGSSACNLAFYMTDAGTPDASGQTSPPSGTGCSCVQVVEALPTDLELALRVLVEAPPFVAGDEESVVAFSATAINHSPRAAVGRFVLPIPSGLTFVETIECPPGATCAVTPGNELEVTGIVVPEGGSFDVSFRARGDCAGVNETRFCAQGWFEPAEDTSRRLLTRDPDAPGEAPTCFKPALPDIVVEKSFRFADLDGSGAPSAGDRIRFLISAWNRGEAAARDALLFDSLPLGFDRSGTGPSAVQVDPAGSYAAGQATWTFGDIGPGTKVDAWVECSMLVDAVAPNRARLSTRVLRDCGVTTILSDNPLTTLAGDATAVTTSSHAAPRATKSFAWDDADADGRPSPGESIRFEIRVRNEGTLAARNAELTDALPACLNDLADVTIVPPDAGSDASTARNLAVRALGGADGLLPDEEVVIQFSTTTTDATLCCNQASLSWDGAPGPALSTDPRGVGDVEPTCLLGATRLVRFTKQATILDLDGDGVATPGDRLRYEIVVRCDGSEIQDLVVTDELPAGTTLDETSVVVDSPVPTVWSQAPAPQGLHEAGRLHAGPFQLATNTTATITFEVVLGDGSVGTTCNQASFLVANLEGPRASEDAALGGASCVEVLEPVPPQIATRLVALSGGLATDCALPGEEMTVDVALDVTGRGSAADVLLQVVSLTGLVVLDPGGGIEAPGSVTWDLGAVPAGNTVVRTLRVEAACDATGDVGFDLAASASNAAPASADGPVVTLARPDVVPLLRMSHDDIDADGALDPGEPLLVELDFDERAGCASGDVAATLALGPELEVVEARDGGSVNGASVDWASAGPAALGRVTVAAVVTLAATAGDCSLPSLEGSASWPALPGTACADVGSWASGPVATAPGPCAPLPTSDLLREDGVADLSTALAGLASLLDEAGVPDSCVPGTLTRVAEARVVAVDVGGSLGTGHLLQDEAIAVGPGVPGQLVFYEVSHSCARIHACKVDADGDAGTGRESLLIGTARCGP